MKTHRIAILAVLFLAIFFASTHIASAKDEWIQVRSKNFYLIGNAPEKEIRKVATRLEQFRETFRLLFQTANLTASIPTNVVVFKSDSAYKPFKPKRADGKTDNFIAGYFQPGEDVNYITLSTEGEDADTFGTIFHEYVHFIIDTNFGKSEVPPWFNEGLAEYYQTFSIEEDQKVKLGLPQSEHLALLSQTKFIPLDTLFKISNYALHQNGAHSRSIFYAESWALIHYLLLNKKGANLDKFLALLLKDVPAERAFQEAFQMGYADMEKLLRKYVEQSTYQYVYITFKNKLTFETEMQASPLSEAESNAYLGDLLYHTNRADDAELYLRNALNLKPDSSMANTTLGMVKIRQRKYDEAKACLEKAISQDQKNHHAFYRYAYLLSRENRDEFGYVNAYPDDRIAKMRELLKKAIALKPSYTESYELLAFVNLVNNEQLDESVALLKTALKYQPGSQRYAVRIAEILARQNKFADALAIAEKIARTADEPEIKSQAEKLQQQLSQQKDIYERNADARKAFDAMAARSGGGNGQPVLIRRSGETQPSPEEMKKVREEYAMRSINESLRKPAEGETRVLGYILKVTCKGKSITYSIKTDTESFTLTSKDFQALALTAFVPEDEVSEVGCDAKLEAIRTVLTYKPAADSKSSTRGELVAVELVPKNFRFIDVDSPEPAAAQPVAERVALNINPATPPQSENVDDPLRSLMMRAIKEAMRKPLSDEKRSLGFIEKSECGSKGMFFYFKTDAQILKLTNSGGQSLYIRGFTPEIEGLQFGCNMKPSEIPVVFTYKPVDDPKSKTAGDLVAIEFVPKSFVLEE
jgi:thioredoxin-like negative regulator of GroEL